MKIARWIAAIALMFAVTGVAAVTTTDGVAARGGHCHSASFC